MIAESAFIATFTFVDNWTEFLRPLIYLNRDEVRTVALAIALNKGMYATRLNYLMASSMVMTLLQSYMLVAFSTPQYIKLPRYCQERTPIGRSL